MQLNFKKAKWIWANENKKDTHLLFRIPFIPLENKEYTLSLSADSNFIIYLNGAKIGFSQYPDFEHYKIITSYKIDNIIPNQTNILDIKVWYYGNDSQTYIAKSAGLIYELLEDDTIIDFSNVATKYIVMNDYTQGFCQNLTSQIGYTFRYDANNINYILGENNFNNFSFCAEINKKCNFYNRPIKKLKTNDLQMLTEVKRTKSSIIFDYKSEVVGFIFLALNSKKQSEYTIAFGEHIIDGCVRYMIGDRNFSFLYTAKKGAQTFIDEFRRFGFRYIEIIGDIDNIFSAEVGVKEVVYPINLIDNKQPTLLMQKIYDVSIQTLINCMHDHYEDCPWREQALYTMDSRNQMLCGYYAFNEFVYPRANLLLLAKGQRKDKLIPLCAPGGIDAPIPFFSLIYILEVYEYYLYSKDKSLLLEVYDVLLDIANVFISKINAIGLVERFGSPYWNFYEWSDGLSELHNLNHECDLPLNAMMIIALDKLMDINCALEKDNARLDSIKSNLIVACEQFYDEEHCLYKTFINDKIHFSVLANSLRILAFPSITDAKICEKLALKENLVDVTLSMQVFFYDCLLKQNKNKYQPFILNDILKNYKFMLDNNATTFWETIKGEADFDKAGSLCHGWSAIPVYYFSLLNETKKFSIS